MDLVTIILGSIIAVDHSLAQNPNWKSNSTLQLIFNVAGSIAASLLGVFSKR